MSKLADLLEKTLHDLFPHNRIIKEHYVNYKDERLFFDFFIKEFNMLIEVQGAQHYKFVKHFHGDKEGFTNQKKRDNLKKAYCEENNLSLMEIRSEDEVGEISLLTKICEAIIP
ncbi:hypothetical protein LCGC14_1387390 [marine sediment metagenome]|uniref:DUF559 domain-containing protein n=1 Tax=marine sediment metagenome TaxID=412755 RepID=A0A0F9MGI5_9ZZZZ